MRIAVVTQSRDRVGGVEAYLQAVLPALAARHAVAFVSESAATTERGAMVLPSSVPTVAIDPSHADPLHAVRAWHPDVVFAHGLDDAAIEAALLGVAPSVIVQHTYAGTCISSSKTMAWPAPVQCERRFGAGCLALYFPRSCGGANPITMVRLYRTQSARLRTLQRASAVVTLSHHMAEEMRRNGVSTDRVHVVPPFVTPGIQPVSQARLDGTCKLLYLGRLERLKGVRHLLEALAVVSGVSKRPLRLIVAGDGAERQALEQQAADIVRSHPQIQIQFAGWQGDEGRARLFAEADALVVPSIWPEPFGLVGLEAAAAGVPAVAFATGGIPEWLHDGENGCLAPARGARPELLAHAILRCVGTPDELRRLSDGARRSSAAWTLSRHVAGLDALFERLAPRAARSRAS
ncbi:MAG: glycosyltransferase family 4 protein [Acidobacteriota bacterium]|nr:glycosyltransferase family 4 protein [Acidobacteriota bacterium]